MKRNKAVNVTKGDIESDFRTEITDHSYYCYKNTENARTYIRHATIRQNRTGSKGFDFQYVSNQSHLTCSCENSGGKCQASGYFITTPDQVQSKSFIDVGVGSVKALQRRKVKRIYLPETEERAVGTLDFVLCENPKCRHFTRFDEFYHRTPGKREESPVHNNKIKLLDKKLSPLVQTKSNFTNPLSTHFLINEINKNVDNTTINKLVEGPADIGAKKLDKSPKTKIFKDLSMNTESIEKAKKSDAEISVERSKLSNDNEVEFSSSLDSLIQHMYNLDKPGNGAVSQVSLDPMENKLEREYRKIFSIQPRNCSCNNKLPTTKSIPLLRRFGTVNRDEPCENDLKTNLSKSSSVSQSVIRDLDIIEPIYRDVSIESDPPSLRSPSNSYVKIVSPVSSNDYRRDQSRMFKKKNLSSSKPRKSLHWCSSDVEDHQGVKRMFKLWGKKLSLEGGCKKRSKLKSFDTKKRSERGVKSIKLLKNKTRDKKERKKFRLFKKKIKVPPVVTKEDVVTGRCEVREGLKIKIGKSFLSQDKQAMSLKKINSEYEELLLKSWFQNFVAQSVASSNNLTMRWNSSVFADCSDATEIKANTSYDTNILILSRSTFKNESLRFGDKKPLINFSRQYFQAWMIPKTILDRLTRTKVYVNAKGDKYNKKKGLDMIYVNDTKCLIDKEVLSIDDRRILNSNTAMKDGSECVMVNISLGCISEFKHKHKQSNEEVYNVINYETPLASSVKFSRKENDKQVPNINDTETTHSKKNNKENYYDHIKESENVQDKHPEHIVNGTKDMKYPILERNSTTICKSMEGSLYLLPKNYKHAEIHLKKYFHNCIPLGLDLHLWCISDSKFNTVYNVRKKDESFQSYPNVTDQIRDSALVTSRDVSIDVGEENSELQEKYNYIKTVIKNKMYEASLIKLGIRIWPKDSLEVFKKRKLYSNRNKAKWNNNHDQSVSIATSIKSKSHLQNTSNKRPPTANKRVTISEIEDKDAKYILPFQNVNKSENDVNKNKNVPYLTTSQQASESIINNRIVPKPKIKECEGNATSQNISTESPKPRSAEDGNNCIPTQTSDITSFPKKTSECPHLNDSNLTKDNICDNRNEKNIEKAVEIKSKSGFNFIDCFKPSNIRNKYNNLRQKFTSERKVGSDGSIIGGNKAKKCSITTDVQKISSISKSFSIDKCQQTSKNEVSNSVAGEKFEPDINRGKAKMSGFHIKKTPIKKNMSRACSTLGPKNYSNVTVNSKNNIEKTSVIKENKDISECIKDDIYRDDNNKKLERKSTSTIFDSKDSHLCNTSAPGSMKNLYGDNELNSMQRNELNKGSDFIEISFKIKRKQIADQRKRNKKSKGNKSSITDKNKAIYLVRNESESSIVYEDCRSCVNLKILIKGFHNKPKSRKDKVSLYSKRISEIFQTVSSGFERGVDGNLNSIQYFKICSTMSVNLQNNNESIKNVESLALKKMADEQKCIIDKPRSKESNNSCRFQESKQQLEIKPVTNETGNEKHSFSCEAASTNYSISNEKISNCKELKKRIIKNIVHRVRDLSKSKRKEKIKQIKTALRAILLSDYCDKSIYANDCEQLKQISGNLGKVTNTSLDCCNFDSGKCLKAQSDVNCKNYYCNVVTKGIKRREIITHVMSRNVDEGQCSKTLAIKSGVTDLRTSERGPVVSEDVKSKPLGKNKERNPTANSTVVKENFAHCISSGALIQVGNEININDSIIKSCNTVAIKPQGQVQQSQDDTKNNAKLVNNKNDEIDKIVCSSFYKEKLIIHKNCTLTSNCTEEQTDIFQLPEIKRAVFELYNASENISNNSDILGALPKFVNEVENVLFS